MPYPKDHRGPIDRAAAVCYRYADRSLQFLLVRARAGGWTFPKGHVERGETAWEAAQREALEEACVRGRIESSPLAIFPYEQRATNGRRVETTVAAYLLRVESESDTPEKGRDPTWFGPEEAKQRLAERRRPRHQQAYFDVVNEACKRLDSRGSGDRPEEG